MRSGRCIVSECEAPLWLVSGATTQTSLLSSRATRSRTRRPGALMPSSLVTRMRGPLLGESACARAGASAIGAQPLPPIEVRAQGRGDPHAAISLLAVLEQRHERAPDREPGAVEGVHQLGAPLPLGAEAGAHPPRLEVAAVRAAGDLAVAALPRQPDLDVVGLARLEAGIAAAQHDHAM